MNSESEQFSGRVYRSGEPFSARSPRGVRATVTITITITMTTAITTTILTITITISILTTIASVSRRVQANQTHPCLGEPVPSIPLP